MKFKRVPVDVDEGESSQWLEVKHGLERRAEDRGRGAILLAANLE